MTDFIRELCDSVLPETYPSYTLPDEVQEYIGERDKIYDKLKIRLEEDDFKLFEKFLDFNSSIHHESECYAFSRGIEFTVRTLLGVFSGK